MDKSCTFKILKCILLENEILFGKLTISFYAYATLLIANL